MSENTHITELSRDYILRQYRMNNNNIIVLFKDLSIPEYIALRTILQYSMSESGITERMYLSDLSEKMKLSMPQISKMAEKLNDKGLVVWTHERSGRSGTYVQITNIGKDFLAEKERLFHDFFGRVIDRYGKDKMIDLIQRMGDLEAIITDEIAKTSDPDSEKTQ